MRNFYQYYHIFINFFYDVNILICVEKVFVKIKSLKAKVMIFFLGISAELVWVKTRIEEYVNQRMKVLTDMNRLHFGQNKS